MLLKCKDIRNNAIFRSLTGLDIAEFRKLLPLFADAWDEHIGDTHIRGKKRVRAYGGGRRPNLRSTEDKLFFILFYFKTYPLRQVLAVLSGMSQSQANMWIHRLAEVLGRALAKESYLPERNPEKSEEALGNCPRLSFVIDGTEREIRRPKDPEKQKVFYSGKRKTHTVKNDLIADASGGKAVYLSGTYEGRKHDKKICDEENPGFPVGSSLYKDTGFQGYEPRNTVCYQPEKKPRGKEPDPGDRISDSMISGVRVIAEHVICGIKRLHIVRDVFRNTKHGFDDIVMEIACGLHNLRVTSRFPNYPKKALEGVWH